MEGCSTKRKPGRTERRPHHSKLRVRSAVERKTLGNQFHFHPVVITDMGKVWRWAQVVKQLCKNSEHWANDVGRAYGDGRKTGQKKGKNYSAQIPPVNAGWKKEIIGDRQ